MNPDRLSDDQNVYMHDAAGFPAFHANNPPEIASQVSGYAPPVVVGASNLAQPIMSEQHGRVSKAQTRYRQLQGHWDRMGEIHEYQSNKGISYGLLAWGVLLTIFLLTRQ